MRLFLYYVVVGIQFAGMVAGWNGGANQGFGEILIANVFIGSMYMLLSMCFAELTSTVAFAGGSFGYCRCTLGPFVGYLVGATEVLENFLYVIVTVLAISTACTEGFGTDPNLEPLWIALVYLFMFVVHLRGGSFLWNFIMSCGFVTVLLVLIFCAGSMKVLDMPKYAVNERTPIFRDSPNHFMQAMYFSTWFYIGVEIVPQTCERVKNVNVNLPRGLFFGNLFSFLVSFWILVGATGIFPGISDVLSSEAFPLSFGYMQFLKTPHSFGALMSIAPSMSAAIGFMYGCGYQVQSLANSGILPPIFAKHYGKNETPYFNLAWSSILQYVVCIVMWKCFPDKIVILYETVVIGASFVYIGVFLAFIVFRTKFGNMKRHWVNVFGIPGAIVGIAIAATMFVSVAFYQATRDALIIYAVFMVLSLIFYYAYAKKHQFFSIEEQRKFMKAYILNANKKNRLRKMRSSTSRLESFFRPVSLLLNPSAKSREQTTNSHISVSSNQSKARTGARRASNVSAAASKHNSIAPAPAASDAMSVVSNANTAAASTMDSRQGYGSSSVAPAPTSYPLTADVEEGSGSSMSIPKKSDALRFAERSGSSDSAQSAPNEQHTILRTSTQTMRASWAISGSMRMNWSGKMMSVAESKKFFDVLSSDTDNFVEKLVVALPSQFILDDEGKDVISTATHADSVALEVDGNVLLNELASTEPPLGSRDEAV